MKIVIIGASGFLGTKLMSLLSEKYEVMGTYFQHQKRGLYHLDILNKEETIKFFHLHKPDVVIDTVSLTSSMQCENNPKLAEKLNYQTAKNISESCKEIDAIMVFMSSSYLFDGKMGDYDENDKTFPINQYARTKIMAEKEVLKNPKSIVLRVDIMYGYNGKNEKNGVFDMILSRKPIQIREPDQLRHPIFVEDIPGIILNLINKDQRGVFHLAGPDKVKMIDFLANLEKIVRKESLISISKDIASFKIKIPKNATLDTSKIRKLGIEFTSLKDGLDIIENQLKN